MSPVEVLRHPSAAAVAESAAARLITTVVEAQAAGRAAEVCLTGGGIGTAVLRAVATNPARDAVDWSAIHLWWGDERYLPTGDPDRNETGARAALIDLVRIDPRNVHPIPDPEASGGDVETAASDYAAELARHARPEDRADVPGFDVLLLGIGPDAHVASLFPEQPALHDSRTCVAVRGAPKPPPIRVTLTLGAICAAQEVWILAAGAQKAGAVRLALEEGAGAIQVPAAGARGRERTLFLIDEPAAGRLPASMGRPGA